MTTDIEARQEQKRRDDFLLHLYDQAHGNINRQFGFVWQSAGVVAAAFGVFAVKGISIDAATCLFLTIAGWYTCNLLDANLWFNRNLLIIGNVERAFLRRSDLKEVHPFFEEHRQDNIPILHLQVQLGLVALLTLLVLGYRESKATAVGMHEFCWLNPYWWLGAIGVAIAYVWRHTSTSYAKVLNTSPGPDVRE